MHVNRPRGVNILFWGSQNYSEDLAQLYASRTDNKVET